MWYVPKLYLETTVFNFCLAKKESKKKQDTLELFDLILEGKFEVYTSQLVLNEIAKDIPARSLLMTDFVDRFVKNTLYSSDEATELANNYVKNRVIPAKYLTDARHWLPPNRLMYPNGGY